jgi:hypothetical protein
MTQMIDTEGAEIPKDKNGLTYFDVYMCDMKDGKGPDLSMNIPMFFEDGNGDQYGSARVLFVPIQDVLDDYIKGFKDSDGGHGVPKFVEWLRDYANRLESANTNLRTGATK